MLRIVRARAHWRFSEASWSVSHAIYRTRQHRESGAVVIVRCVHGRPTGAVDAILGIPPETWEFRDDRALIEQALGPDYEDAAIEQAGEARPVAGALPAAISLAGERREATPPPPPTSPPAGTWEPLR